MINYRATLLAGTALYTLTTLTPLASAAPSTSHFLPDSRYMEMRTGLAEPDPSMPDLPQHFVHRKSLPQPMLASPRIPRLPNVIPDLNTKEPKSVSKKRKALYPHRISDAPPPGPKDEKVTAPTAIPAFPPYDAHTNAPVPLIDVSVQAPLPEQAEGEAIQKAPVDSAYTKLPDTITHPSFMSRPPVHAPMPDAKPIQLASLGPVPLPSMSPAAPPASPMQKPTPQTAAQPVQMASLTHQPLPKVVPIPGEPTSVAPNFQPTQMAQVPPTAVNASPYAPRILPLPSNNEASQTPTFKPYATIETQKDKPMEISPRRLPRLTSPSRPLRELPKAAQAKPLEGEPARSNPAIVPLPPQEPVMRALPMDQAASQVKPVTPLHPDEEGAVVMPAPKVVPHPETVAFEDRPNALKDHAARMAGLHSQRLSSDTKRILSSLPAGAHEPAAQRGKAELNRFDPEIEGILNDQVEGGDGQEVASHNSSGLKVEVRRPSLNINIELEKAYQALIASQPHIAIDIYKRILKSAPRNQDALFGIATTFHRIDELELARAFYSKLLTLNPRHREGFNNFLALVAQESPEEAITQLEQLKRDHPNFSPVYAQLALLHDQTGDREQAKRNMAKAAQLEPNNLAYKYNLAVLVDKYQNYKTASTLYRQLLVANRNGLDIPADPESIQDRLTYINEQIVRN